MKKNNVVPLPATPTLLVVIGELVNCHAATLHTGKDSDNLQSSHPGADFCAFPTILLTVEKEKQHYLQNDGQPPYLIIHNKRFSDMGLFVKLNGTIETFTDRDDRLVTVIFRVKEIQLKKVANLATKETWNIAA